MLGKSISYQLLAAFVAVSLLPVAAVAYLLSRDTQEQLTTLEKQHLARQAAGLAGEVELYFANRYARLEGAASWWSSTGALTSEQLSELTERDPNILLAAAYFGGRFIAPPVEIESSTKVKDLIKQLLEGPWSCRRKSKLQQEGFLLAAMPIVGLRDGKCQGTVALAVSLEPLARRFKDQSLKGLAVSLVDDEGTTVISSDPTTAGKNLSQSPVVQAAMEGLRLAAVYQHPASEEKVLGAAARVEGFGCVVVVEKKLGEAFAAAKAMSRKAVAVSLIAVAAASILALVVGRRLTDPIRRLSEATTSIARGQLSARIPVKGSNELAILADNFNKMADSVSALVEKLQESVSKNRELFRETIRTIAAAIDAKDPYTRGHSDRVCSYSVAIGKQMGLGREELSLLWIAAILHDVGKLGIRDSVLNKPGLLSPEEFEEMKKHPEIGAQIMSPIKLLEGAIPGIRSHHERWDGTGYPEGLVGEQIPLIARIIAVADTFDAMTTDRPYQKAFGLEYVVAKMKQWAGTRFDPRVIDAFVKAVERGDISLKAVGVSERKAGGI